MADKLYSELNKGAWINSTAYTVGDFVSLNGSSYVCIANNTNQTPPNVTYWALLAEKGSQGETGQTGLTGAPGAQGIPGTSFIWKGAWSGATGYVVNDVVSSGGNSYICISAHTNHTPPNGTYWELVAQKGTDGAGTGDVVGPASSTDNRVAVFDGVTGKLIKDSGLSLSGSNTGDETATSLGSKINGSDAKTSMVDADKLAIVDTEASNILKTLSWSYIKSILKTYFDTLYNAILSKSAGSDITTGTDDAKYVTSKALADATSGKLGAAWTSFTPTWTNLTKGSATIEAKYCQIGKTVHFRISLVLAANTSISGAVDVSLPVTSVSYPGTAAVLPIGVIGLIDSSGSPYTYQGTLVWNSTTTARIYVYVTSGAYSSVASITATVPFTFTTGDEIHLTGTYEAA